MKGNWIKTLGLAALAAAAALGSAQDYQTLGGGNDRLGRNSGAALNGAGRGLLTWYAPLINDVDGYTLIRDNLSTAVTRSGVWTAPAAGDEAPGSYIGIPETPTIRADEPVATAFWLGRPVREKVNYFENALRGLIWNGALPAPGGYSLPPQPTYLYSPTVPSAADPTVKQFGADTLSVHEWAVEPPADPNIPNQRYARNYALYAYINIGPTGDGVGGLIYPQRYYVYEIIYNGTKRFVDVVDTYAGGTAWVRLGNGGSATDRLFTYNGVDPIKIRLLNTVPRRTGHVNDPLPNPYPINDPKWLNTYPDQPYSSIVYADAVKAVPATGEYSASPIVTALNPAIVSPISVFDARNEFLVGSSNGDSQTTRVGVVRRRDYNTGAEVWKFVPLNESTLTTLQDNNSAGVTSAAPWAVSTFAAGYKGTNYLKAPCVTVAGTEQYVTYTPNLVDGTYEVQVWMPGSRGGEVLATQVVYLINEGATTTTVTVDQSVQGGWVRLGNRRFTQDTAGGNPLTVQVSNLSTNGADLGRDVLADAMQFVGAANLAVTSTPVHAVANVVVTNGGTPTLTPVILIAAEDGKIYCLDATGNGDGTTNVYWTYPSTPDPNNAGWTDPNAIATEDGGVAQMPTGFDMSTALVQTIGGVDYLFIASKNGRIYSIEMAGRGDMDLVRRVPGTTRRVWTYPNDFPAQAQKSTLGSFQGSLTYGVTAAGPTIFAGAPQGRMYALEAMPAVVTNKTTNVRWTYPALNAATLGPIRSTPVYFNNNVFFGTDIATNDDRGRFFSLNADTGAVNWQFNGTTLWGGGTFVNADGFISTPATATSLQLAGTDPDMIYVANDNRWITGLDATNGNVLWTTDELNSPVLAGLTVANINVFDNVGVRTTAPLVMVPTADGRFAGLFAKSGAGFPSQNVNGRKLAWGFTPVGAPILATMSSGRSFIYGADQAGFIWGFNDLGNGLGGNIESPGEETIVDNDPDPDVGDFRNAKLIFVTKDTYQRLRLPQNDPARLTYAEALDPLRAVARTAFDWGETIYALAYDFPYQNTYVSGTLAGTPAPPPYVNFQIGVEGAAIRNLTLESQQFKNPNTAPLAASGTRRLDGYACLAYIIQSGGSNSMPPGSGRASFTISTTALRDPPQAISITPTNVASARVFIIANPLGLIMVAGDPLRQIGTSIDPSDPENGYNGNRDDPTTGAKFENLLFTSPGILSQGNAGTTVIGVVDRSLMTLLRGPGRGLDNVRFSRGDLAWQGGKGQVLKRIDSIPYYAAFYGVGKGLEDYPEFFPNISLDYPDIQREQIAAVSDINGPAENPIFGVISLRPPTGIDETVNPPFRVNNPTPWDLTISTPRFQPANLNNGNTDSGGAAVVAGYYGNMAVFVDSNGDGQLSRNGGRREAFRSFWLGNGVAVDERFLIETPTVDLGSLASGTGYDPADPTTGTTFSPWGGAFQPLFKPFVIRNIGNVNLLNLRMAKFYANGTVNPWELFSTSGHELSWLQADRNLHSTLDPLFALVPAQLVLPKARVGDANGTTYSDNPHVRDNANINAVAQPLLTGQPDPSNPVVAMSVPLGWPVGAYQAMIRIIEDTTQDLTLPVGANGQPLETMSEPGMIVKAQIHETQATTTSSAFVATNIDDLLINQNENYFWLNNQPAAMRSSGGHLVSAFVSDRIIGAVGTNFDKTLPTAPLADNPTRLYFASVQGVTPGAAAGTNSLRDLNGFIPQPPRWWRRDVADYPTQAPATLFPGTDPIVAGTPRYFAPNMPASGDRHPITGVVNASTYVAFVGTAQKQGASERYGDTRVFIAPVTVAADGSLTVGAPTGLPNDTAMQKARPSVLQLGTNAVVFFTSYGTGQTLINYATFDGTNWGQTRVFTVGNGFEMVGSPNISARVYEGLGGTGLPATGSNIIEVSFTGKRRGRPANEIFMGRMALNGVTPGNQYYFPVRTQEIMRADSATGTFSASGVDWNLNANAPQLFYKQGNAVPVNIETPGTRVVDATTGVISFDTSLGGKAFLDPSLGTVRLANSLPARNSLLMLSYQPKFLRISTSDVGYANSSLLFDNRLIGETSYWANPTNTAVAPLDPVRSGRYLFTYSRAAAGTGQAPRPYVHTIRPGITLPRPVATTQSGNVNVTVTGLGPVPNAFYQVDPANGRIYFTANMENRPVTVTYTSIDEVGNVINQGPDNYTVTLITERTESPIFMNQAVNESQLTSFLDPFEETTPNLRRPGLIWLFWTSTRGGTPDMFFQTIAPRFTPLATN